MKDIVGHRERKTEFEIKTLNVRMIERDSAWS